jgi:shikimate kinase
MRNRDGASWGAASVAPEDLPHVRTVFLVGFMGAGKTSVGCALAARLGWLFEDLDDRIERREGKTVEQIFQVAGETAFRKAETAALRELLASLGPDPRVVALGGGAFAQAANAALIADSGAHAVFLDAPVAELLRRCQKEKKSRPLGHDVARFGELYEARRPAYLKAAVHIETGGKDVEAVALEVACSLGLD